jgi:spermidine/putrescine transport system permease protein
VSAPAEAATASSPTPDAPPRAAGRGERDSTGRRRAGPTPWLLLAPGMLWLVAFFFVPLYSLFRMSLSERVNRFADPTFSWEWGNYSEAFQDFLDQFLRSFVYGFAATALALLIGYPLAYVIAFRGGRWRNVLLGLVVVPFFTNFLIRTLAWRTILGNEGPVIDVLRDVGVLGSGDTLLRTSWAVIGGLMYNFLPFMVLPIYVAIEKIDPALVDAARDLYSTTWRAFRKVVFPMSLPGVFAGSLLVFIPASGDFVNAYYLGNAKTTMIGNVVQDQFLVQNDYPVAAALSFVFMAIVMVFVLLYAFVLGTEDLT